MFITRNTKHVSYNNYYISYNKIFQLNLFFSTKKLVVLIISTVFQSINSRFNLLKLFIQIQKALLNAELTTLSRASHFHPQLSGKISFDCGSILIAKFLERPKKAIFLRSIPSYDSHNYY